MPRNNTKRVRRKAVRKNGTKNHKAVASSEEENVESTLEEESAALFSPVDENEELRSIYAFTDDGEERDMTKMDRKRRRGKWVIIVFAVLTALLASAYFGYRIFKPVAGSNEGTVDIQLHVDEKVASGDVVTIEVEYMNNKNTDITTGDIELFYPNGFYFESASIDPSDDTNKVWTIQHIRPGTGGKIRITGQLVGEQNSTKDISALFTYRPANFSHDFQVTAKTSVNITSSLVTVSVDAPAQVQSGQEFNYDVSYTNASTAPLKNAEIRMNYPEGFRVVETDPKATNDENTEWRIDTIEPNQTQKIHIKATVDGNSGDTKQVQFQFGLLEVDNTFNVQIEKTSDIVVINPEVQVFLSAPDTVSPGDQIPLTVTVNNTSDVEMKDVHAKLHFEGSLFEESDYDFDVVKKLGAQGSQELTHTITLKKDTTENNIELAITASVESAMVEGNAVSFGDDAKADVHMKVKGTLVVDAAGYYFDENLKKIGDGPLPPTVGQETTYSIQWTIQSGMNDIQDFSLSTVLPQNVTWKNNATDGMSYDKKTRTVSFSSKSLESQSQKTFQFMVSITPTAQDVDSLMVLTGETAVTAMDSFTKQPLSQQLPRITTDLSEDEGAKGKGVVE